MREMAKSTTFSAPYLRSLLTPNTKIHRSRISFSVRPTDIGDQYDLYSRTCTYVSSMIKVVDFSVSYSPSVCHPLPLHHRWNYISRRPNYFFLRRLQCISEYYFTLSFKNILCKFTTSIPGMVQNKISKTSISLGKSEGDMHSGNQINLRNKTCWKILVWFTKINLRRCKNDQKLFLPWFIPVVLQ